MNNSLEKFILLSDGWIHFDKSVQLEWHYNEAHHGKAPMDGISKTIKRVVFGLVKSNKITINTAEEFATEAFKALPSIQSIHLSQDDEIIEPSFVKLTPYIQFKGLLIPIMRNVLLTQMEFVF